MRTESDPSKWLPATSALQLQRPDYVYFAGEVRPWEDAALHVSTEAVVRGLNVFEGLKAYWQEDGRLALRSLPRHFARMQRSASLLHIPVPVTYDEFEEATFSLVRALARPDRDLYIRATLFVVQGHYGEGTLADLVLTGYQLERKPPNPIDMGVTTWRRAVDTVMSPRIKTGANYQSARLARIEGRSRGYEDMVFLNQWDRVAESSAACVLLVRDGRVLTPPSWEGALESITVDMVAEIADSLGVEFVRRPIDRSELYIGEELGLTGTLTEITFVRALDGYGYPDPPPLLSHLLERYRNALLGVDPHPAVDLVVVPFEAG